MCSSFTKHIGTVHSATAYDVEVKSKWNSVTQAYYVKRLLPVYLQSYNEARMMDLNPILQEDNDNSHGTWSSNNVIQQFKAVNWILRWFVPRNPPFSLSSLIPAYYTLGRRIVDKERFIIVDS